MERISVLSQNQILLFLTRDDGIYRTKLLMSKYGEQKTEYLCVSICKNLLIMQVFDLIHDSKT